MSAPSPTHIVDPLPETFWLLVNFDGPIPEHAPHLGKCWIWNGAKVRKGYGLWRPNEHTKSHGVHRWVFEDLVGPIPPGLELDHLCRVHECCNPDHMEPVTHGENIRRGQAASDKRAKFLSATHCKRGHDLHLYGVIAYIQSSGWFNRHCTACKSITDARLRDARRAA